MKTKRQGRQMYGVLGYKLSRAFNEKWTKHEGSSTGEELLVSVDPSALADYNAVYETVSDMRYIPITLKHYVLQAIMLALPFLPLVFLEFSITELVKRLFDSLI